MSKVGTLPPHNLDKPRGMVEIINNFAVEAVQQFRPNVSGFQLATGGRRWYIVGCYLSPNYASTIESVVAALKEWPQVAKLLVAGYFNVKLSYPEGYRRGEDIAAALVTEGIEDISAHFLPLRRSRCQYGRTCSIIRAGREASSWMDYILVTDRRIFCNVSVLYPRHNLDHYMVLGCLCRAPLREHSRCLGGHKRIPLRPPTTPTREDGIFAALRRSIPKPQAREARKNALISEATWRLVNERVSALQDPAKDQSLIQRLGRAISEILKGYRRRQAEEAGAGVEALLGSDPPLRQEACHIIKGWYRAEVDRAPPPDRFTLEQITAERVDIYSYVPSPGVNTSISVEPFPVDDSVPTEDNI